MELLLQRRPSARGATIGELFDVTPGLDHPDGRDRLCFMLEDVVREAPGRPVSEWKIVKETAIPAGRYQVVIDFSTRFQRKLPHLLNVPGFSGIRWHPGNYAQDTEGCQLPGTDVVDNRWVSRSAAALDRLVRHITPALERGEQVWVEVRNAESVHF